MDGVTGACFQIGKVRRDFEKALRDRKRLKGLKQDDLLLFEKYDGSYLLLEMGQVTWFNACGISFHTVDSDSAESHLDFVQIRLLRLLRFKKKN